MLTKPMTGRFVCSFDLKAEEVDVLRAEGRQA